jgi:pimeloyl-ACP methyl ester carboxylesterase
MTGAIIAVEVAAAVPQLVDKLVLCCCPYIKPELRKARLNDPFYQLVGIREDGKHLSEIWDRYRPPQTTPEAVQLVVLGYLMAGEGAEVAHYSFMKYKIEERLPLIECPTLLITGGSTDKYHSTLNITTKMIPHNRSLVIEEGGNFMPIERPNEFAQAVIGFLKNPTTQA